MRSRIIAGALLASSLVLVLVSVTSVQNLQKGDSNLAAISGTGSGLIAHYTFESALSDGSTSAKNASSGGVSYVAGKIGNQAIKFDGVSGIMYASNIPTPRTVAFWVKAPQKGTLYTDDVMSIGSVGSYTNAIGVYIAYSNEEKFKAGFAVPFNFFDDSNTWKHVAWTEGDGVGKLYIDGVLQGQVEFVLNPVETRRITLGAANYRGIPYAYFPNAYDDFRAYDRTLSAAEISEVYNLGLKSPGGVTIDDGGVVFNPKPPTSDTTAPVISNITVGSITSSGAIISWNTDESADTQIEYGLSTTYGNTGLLNSNFGTTHTVALSSLLANTTYNFRVKSKDLAGNLAVSGNSTFTTSAKTGQGFSLIVEKSGTGSGTITGGSINCGGVCSQSNISSGTSITLKAVPATESTFVGWSGGGCSGTGSCVLSVTSDTVVSAVFNSNTVPVGGAPTVPGVLGAVGVSARQINISWETSLGPVRAAKYDVYRNGTLVGSTGTLAEDHIWKDPGLFQDVGLTPDTTYTYYVKAVSASGVESEATRSVTARTKDASQTGIIPSARLYDWTPGVNVGVPGGIPTNRTNIIDVTKAPYFASGSIETTTGSGQEGSRTLTVSAPADFKAGQSIQIKNAGRNIYVYDLIIDLSTAIESINGNTFTLKDPIQAPVTNSLVTHNDGAVIDRAIKEAPDNSVIYLPAGIYRAGIGISRDNITVRGAGMDATVIECTGGCAGIGRTDGFYNMPKYAIVSGAYKGSNKITAEKTDWIGVGSMIRITGDRVTSPPESIDMTTTGGHYSRGQEVIVTAKSGNTLTFNIPIMASIIPNPVVIPSAGYATMSGIEDITLDALKSRPTFAASIGSCYGCWFKNVKIKGAGNYTLSLSGVMNEVRHSYLDAQDSNGTNHAGLLGGGTGNLFEDNIVLRSQPLIEINGGAAGNVFAYNFMTGGAANTNHAPHNQYNLYEGNYIDGGMISDGYFGGESEQTIFRNWISGSVSLKRWSRNFSIVGNQLGGYSMGQPNIGNASSEGTVAPSAGVYWFDWNPTTGPGTKATVTRRHDDHKIDVNVTVGASRLFNYCQALGGYCLALGFDDPNKVNYYGREIGRSGNTMTIEIPYAVAPAQGTELSVWPRSEGFQEKDLDVLTTTILKANKYTGISGYVRGINESLQTGEVLTNSLYLNSKPAWFGNLQWPPFSPTNPNYNDAAIPAAYRYKYGTEAPGVTGIYSNPVIQRTPAIPTKPVTSGVTNSVPSANTITSPQNDVPVTTTTKTTSQTSKPSTQSTGGGSVTTPVPTVTQKPVVTTSSSLYLSSAKSFTKTLSLGSQGPEVVLLQKTLANIPGIYPQKKESGIYGTDTELAVQRFQVKYGIAQAGEAGYGVVGPKTRVALNARLK